MFGISDAGLFLSSSAKKENKAKQVQKLGRFVGNDTHILVNGYAYDGSVSTLYPLTEWSGSSYTLYGDTNREISITGEGFVSTIMLPIFNSDAVVELTVNVDGDIYTEIFDLTITNSWGRIVLTDTTDVINLESPCSGKFRCLYSYYVNLPSPLQNVQKIWYEKIFSVSYNLLAGNFYTSSSLFRHFIVVGIKF